MYNRRNKRSGWMKGKEGRYKKMEKEKLGRYASYVSNFGCDNYIKRLNFFGVLKYK